MKVIYQAKPFGLWSFREDLRPKPFFTVRSKRRSFFFKAVWAIIVPSEFLEKRGEMNERFVSRYIDNRGNCGGGQ